MNTAETNIREASIQIARKGSKLSSVSVVMPIWTKQSDYCNLTVNLPLLGIKTIAKDEKDSENAIKEAITSFCVVAEKFGQGLEKELLALGWVMSSESGEPSVGYTLSCDSDTDALLERLMETGENYVNPHLEIA